ncbi:MAG: hypothetical protein NVSMB27_18520 [Ktedonobacteraceae bacterium]
MSGQMQWTPDSDGMLHPDDSILLAYTRQQSLGINWPSIHQHIVGCERCLIRCESFTVTSQSITDMLAAYHDKQYYPPLTERLSEYIENPVAANLALQKRQQERLREDLALGRALLMLPLSTVLRKLSPARGKPRNSTSVTIFTKAPALAFLVLLGAFVTVSIYANWIPPFLHAVGTGITRVQDLVIGLPPNPTSTPNAISIGIPPVSLTGKPAPTTPKPSIRLCTSQPDKNVWRISFCGSNFPPGDKVALYVGIDGNQPRAGHRVTVDSQGNFQDSWILNYCRDVPTAVYAQDMAHPKIVSQTLQNIQFAKCQ